MTEIGVNRELIEQSALNVVSRLKEVVANCERTFPSTIDAVLVFSGPGTYYDKLKPGQEEVSRWRDRDRIRAGVAVVREVTASKISEISGYNIKGKYISKEDIERFGPFLVYNGVPIKDPNLQHENLIFRRALNSPFCKLPKEKVIVIDEVCEENGESRFLLHTGDQVRSLFHEVVDPNSPLYGVTNIALVSHISGIIRVPYYTKKYNDERIKRGETGLNFWLYGLKDRPGVESMIIKSELESLIRYAQQGDLATEPSNFSF